MNIITKQSVDNKPLKITNAKYIGAHQLHLTFDDGMEQTVDFSTFVKNAWHPSIKKYMDEGLFSSFSITDGNLNWNDYEMIFPIWDLYQGHI